MITPIFGVNAKAPESRPARAEAPGGEEAFSTAFSTAMDDSSNTPVDDGVEAATGHGSVEEEVVAAPQTDADQNTEPVTPSDSAVLPIPSTANTSMSRYGDAGRGAIPLIASGRLDVAEVESPVEGRAETGTGSAVHGNVISTDGRWAGASHPAGAVSPNSAEGNHGDGSVSRGGAIAGGGGAVPQNSLRPLPGVTGEAAVAPSPPALPTRNGVTPVDMMKGDGAGEQFVGYGPPLPRGDLETQGSTSSRPAVPLAGEEQMGKREAVSDAAGSSNSRAGFGRGDLHEYSMLSEEKRNGDGSRSFDGRASRGDSADRLPESVRVISRETASDGRFPPQNRQLLAADGKSRPESAVVPDSKPELTPKIETSRDAAPPLRQRIAVKGPSEQTAVRVEPAVPLEEKVRVRSSHPAPANDGTASGGQSSAPPSPPASATGRASGDSATIAKGQPTGVLPSEPESVAAPRSDAVTLRVPDADGNHARIRVAVRGDQVKTTIIHDDPARAAQLSSQSGDLRQALVSRGFGDTSISVQASRGEAVGSQLNSPGNPAAPASDSGATGDAREDGRDPKQQQRDASTERHDRSDQRSRQRNRREQPKEGGHHD